MDDNNQYPKPAADRNEQIVKAPQATSIAPESSNRKVWIILAVVISSLVFLVVAGVAIFVYLSSGNLISGRYGKISKGQFSNRCFAFDAEGLKIETKNTDVQYECETALSQDNEGYFPVATALSLKSEGETFDQGVQNFINDSQSLGLQPVSNQSITIDDAQARLVIFEKDLPSNVSKIEIDGSDSVELSRIKKYLLAIDSKGKTDRLDYIFINGSYSERNATHLDKMINTWQWQQVD